MRSWLATLGLSVVLVPLLSQMLGCRATIPQHPWTGPDNALRVLAERHLAVRTLSARCTLRLRQANGQSITLDAVLLAQGTQHLRLRAWKLSQAVFDLTLVPDGLWLSTGATDRPSDQTARITAVHVAEVWAMLSGRVFRDGQVTIDHVGDRTLEAHAPLTDGRCTMRIDRPTLTIRQYRFTDDQGRPRQTLSLKNYRMFGGCPWPTLVIATGPEGRIILELADVEINGELAAGAFVPPAAAVKQP
jgi:hypothetical protein